MNKKIIVFAFFLFVIGLVVLIYTTRINVSPNAQPSSGNYAKLAYDQAKFDQAYFDKAINQGRELTAEEKDAYINMMLPEEGDNLITVHHYKKEVVCNIVSENEVREYYLKNGNIRFNYIDNSTGENAAIIYTPDELWAWYEGAAQQYIKIKDQNERNYLLFGTIFPSDNELVNSPKIFKESCRYESVSDKNFTPPAGIGFESMEE